MLRIPCPWCGERDETEFAFGGQSHVARPPFEADDASWARYLFVRDNPKGPHSERWCHTYGCAQWFNVVRDTTTHQFLHAYRLSDPRPDATAKPI
jgi:sarcosine oxidase subunit delta